MRSEELRRAVFLDRDGTVNVEKAYLHQPEEFEFIPGAPEAIRLLKDDGFFVVVVTNQSGVARGYYDEEAVHRLHRFVDRELAAAGASIDAYYLCPHHPLHGVGPYRVDCACRKPLPGMILAAAAAHGIDLGRSWLVGDKAIDVEAGLAAGCRPILVRTGYGVTEASLVPPQVPVCDDLLAAAQLILAEEGGDRAGEAAGGDTV
ncbi:D-glycero-beta-D-manno-heptose 1,7-bisphosphate 7-phosphatase [Geobacter pickeringii]|uniref:D,D-heptose 1,7-bisphosphate phosphatase n=1 Tax=Geobacter pickeringii TaxID=345632 RepID=A0A0B5B8I8_9BACT|nr:D-glycero-beta-D-manno-heptose 1,7-bisphosphate 7-phosphatase [Geobacter pickeringii]AJE02857.1 D,D-heptose 1,7-bisphosphate phosphatase [Geobacter pickeringii]